MRLTGSADREGARTAYSRLMGRRWMLLLALAVTAALMVLLVTGWLDVGPLAGHVGGSVGTQGVRRAV